MNRTSIRRVRSRRIRPAAALAALATAGCLALAACAGSGPAGSGGSPSGKPVAGGTATFAENPAAGTADYIFPMVSLTYDTPTNLQFQYLMYRPLYWFGQGDQPSMNAGLSLADPPVYSDGDKVVTIHLKPYQWSDGKPLTSRDVVFWINLLRANTANWAAFLPGGFPQNVTSVTTQGPQTVRLRLNRAYNPQWFTQTQLAQIVPLPQHAWDKTSASAAVGNYDKTAAGARAVRTYLDGQARQLTSYASNPLWRVVDGPWTLHKFRTDGYAEFVPNHRYSGPDRPKLKTFIMQPFTSDQAEFDVLRSGDLSYGYVPLTDLSQKQVLERAGYRVTDWPSWSISYIVLNFNNPATGPMFRQLYIRQALQQLIDQPGYIHAYLQGNGVPTNGPVPLQPASSFVTPQLKAGFYHYSPKAAISLLRGHGWDVRPNGTTTCAHPGTGASQCGAGIAAGAPLKFSLQYLSGVSYLGQEMQSFKSALTGAGIQLSLSQGSEGQVLSTATACPKGPGCTWQMAQWGSPSWIWPSAFPSGEAIFATGAGVNAGSYSDHTNDANIAAVQTSASPTALQRYENYLGQQLPVLWLPNTYNQVSAIKTSLAGVQQTPLLFLTPEQWAFTQ
jgi:peptide/nickel transport system substrate-binding protein